MRRWLLLPLLCDRQRESRHSPAKVSVPRWVSVKVYSVGVAADRREVCAAVATSVLTAPMLAAASRVTVRLSLPDVPVRVSSSVTLKLTLFSVSAVCSGGFIVKVCDWLLPLMATTGVRAAGSRTRQAQGRHAAPADRAAWCRSPGISDGSTVIGGAAGVASGPFGLLTVAVLLISAPGACTLSTVTSNTTVTRAARGHGDARDRDQALVVVAAGRRRERAGRACGNRNEAGEGGICRDVIGDRHAGARRDRRTRSA